MDVQPMQMMDTPRRSIYNDSNNNAQGLQFRLDNNDIIKRTSLRLRGAIFDEYNRVKGYDEKLRVINDTGAYQIITWLEGVTSKNTHLTNFSAEDRVNQHTIRWGIICANMITQHAKEWEITNKDTVQMSIEKALHESMLKAQGGFENNNISHSHTTQEYIENNRPQQGGGLFSFFRGGGNRGNN